MSTEIGSLLIDMRADVARLSQDMNKVQSTVDGAMKNVKTAADRATTALGLIGVGVSIAGMISVVKNAVNAMAALDDMAAAAGTTVENMSALADIAKIGGHELGTVEAVMIRLAKALAGGDNEAKGAGHALATLGLKAEELRNMDTAEAMLAVAMALSKFENGAGKTALMMDLLGKSGAAAIPFFEDLAEKGALVAKVTTEQAAEAEKLQKDLNQLKVASDDLTRSLAVPLVGALGEVIKNFKAAREAGYDFFQSLTGFGVRGLNETVGAAKANSGKRIKELQEEIAKHERDRDWMRGRGDTVGARGYDAEIAQAQQRIKYYQGLQRAALDDQWSGTGHLDARDLAARQKGSLTGYESKDDKDKKKKHERAFDPEGDMEFLLDEAKRKRLRADFDARDKEADDEAKALEKRRLAMEAMAERRMEDTRIATEGEEAIREAMEKTGHAADKHFGEMSEFAREAARNIQDSLADNLYDALQGKFDNIGSRFKSMLDRMVANAMAARLSDAMFGDFGKSGNLGGIAGELLKGLRGGETGGAVGAEWDFGVDQTPGVTPAFAGGGDHAGGWRKVGENGPELEATGPSRIFSADQTRDILSGASGGGNVTVNVIESPSQGGQVRQRNDGGQQVIDVMVAKVKSDLVNDIRSEGSFARAAQGTWGLNRAAGAM